VDSLDVLIQALAVVNESRVKVSYSWPESLADGFEGKRELTHDLLTGQSAVEIQHEIAETSPRQPTLHYLEGCALFSHEQNPLAVSDQFADEVGDRLALARARRSDDYARLTLENPDYRSKLA